MSRFVRRSCRPNVQIEIAIDPDDFDQFEINLLALNNIYEGDEILLPNDFDFGNNTFKYDCACGNPEFCLSSCLFGSFFFNSEGKKGNQSTSGISQESDSDTFCSKSAHFDKWNEPQPEPVDLGGQSAINFEDPNIETEKRIISDISTTHEVIHSSVVITNSASVTSHTVSKTLEINDEEFVDVEIISDETSPRQEIDSAKSFESENNTTPIPSDDPIESTSEPSESSATPNKVKVSLSDYIRLRKTTQSIPQSNSAVELQASHMDTIHSDTTIRSPYNHENSSRRETREWDSGKHAQPPVDSRQFSSPDNGNSNSFDNLIKENESLTNDDDDDAAESPNQSNNNQQQKSLRNYEHSYFKSSNSEKTTHPDPYRYSNGSEKMNQSLDFDDSYTNHHRANNRRSLSPSGYHQYQSEFSEYAYDYYTPNSTNDHRYHHPTEYLDRSGHSSFN